MERLLLGDVEVVWYQEPAAQQAGATADVPRSCSPEAGRTPRQLSPQTHWRKAYADTERLERRTILHCDCAARFQIEARHHHASSAAFRDPHSLEKLNTVGLVERRETAEPS